MRLARIDVTTTSGAPRVALVSPCGWGNLGDAAIQMAVIDEVRARHPDARLVAFTLRPADTEERHGIPAFPISGISSRGYGAVVSPRPWFQRVLSAARALPLLWRWAEPAVRFVHSIVVELHHVSDTARHLAELDLVLVSGGGQLDEQYGGPWGHPYALFKWSVLARRARKPIAFLSVGTGRIRASTTRYLLRGALREASYASFRDPGSARVAQSELGVPGKARVVPDLALGIPGQEVARDPTHGPLVVAVSPIALEDAQSPDYLERLGALLGHVAAAGHHIVFFTTSPGDRAALATLHQMLPALAGGGTTRIAASDTVDDVLSVLRSAHVAIASRLHSVILAHVTACPVLALSYDRKVAAHMDYIGQGERCVPIDGTSADVLIAAFERLTEDRCAAAASLHAALVPYREALRIQYDAVLGGPPHASHPIDRSAGVAR